MPVISMFYGIIVSMFYKEHNPPHIHVQYSEYNSIFDFEGNLTDGDIPINQRKLVEAWIVLHKEELEANWKLAQEKQGMFRIDPLK